MGVHRCLRIETASLEPESLKVFVVSRVVARAGVIDYAIAIGSVFALSAGVGLLFFDTSDRMPLTLLVIVSGLLALVVSPAVAGVVRWVRRRLGRIHRLEVSIDPGSLRGQPQLQVGPSTYAASDFEAVALLGWQEVAATDRLWDVMLVRKAGGSVDVVTGHATDDGPRELGQALATALNVEFRESSNTGGSVNTLSFDQRGMPRLN